MEPLIQIATIVRYLVEHWHQLTGAIWNSLLHLFGLQADAGVVALLNAGAFCFALEIAAATAPKHVPSLGSMALGVFNRIVTSALFCGILFSAFVRSGEHFTPLPDPLEFENWLDRKNWLPLGAWLFAMSFANGVGGNPYVLAKRLLDVAIFCLAILALNYIALYGPMVRAWIASF